MELVYNCKICGTSESKVIVDNIKDWEYGFEGSYEYRKCSKCNSIQIHPFPSMQDFVESYKVDYHGFVPPTQKGALYSFLFKLIQCITKNEIRSFIHPGSNVLDVGCGIGLFLNELKSMGFHNLEGIDFSEKAVKIVNKNGITCHLGTFLDFVKENRSYDLIVMNNYLEHTTNPLSELKKAHGLLKDKGVLLGEIPNFDSLDRIIFGRFWGGNHVPRHAFQFNARNLKELLKQAGFKTIKIKYPLNTSHFALSIQNVFQRNSADLKNNANLVHGRDKYYSLYMIGLLPINMVCVLLKKSGFMRFYASP